MEIYNMNTEYHIHMTKFEDIKGVVSIRGGQHYRLGMLQLSLNTPRMFNDHVTINDLVGNIHT
jgi:hypothetical protein